MHKIIIEPRRGISWKEFKEIWEYRDVAMMLAVRDVKLRYKQTVLGVVWVILQPLVAGVIFAVIFGHLAKMPSDGNPYILFIFAGLLAWNLFAASIQRAGNSLVTDAKLITKVYFPRILVPIASTFAVLLDFLISLFVMAALMVYYLHPPTIMILTLPAWVLLAYCLSLGVSLWLSALNVKYRDFMYAVPFLIQVWMFASPVVYSSKLIPEKYLWIFSLNPMVGILEGFRFSLLNHAGLNFVPVFLSLGVTLLLLVAGLMYFRSVENQFADIV